MSDKIYDGMRFKKNLNLVELNQFYKTVRSEIKKAVNTEYHKMVASIFESIYVYAKTGVELPDSIIDLDCMDLTDISMDEAINTAQKLAYEIIQFYDRGVRNIEYFQYLTTHPAKDRSLKRITIVNQKNEPKEAYVCNCLLGCDCGFRASMSVLPIKDHILFIPYSDNKTFKDIMTKRDEVEEYGYWNNVDPLETVSEEDWEQRRIDWNEALEGIGVPVENGFTIDFAPIEMIKTVFSFEKHIKPFLKPKEELAFITSKEKLFQEKYVPLYNESQECYSSMQKAKKYVKEHSDEVEKYKAEIEQMLPSELSVKDDIVGYDKSKYVIFTEDFVK